MTKPKQEWRCQKCDCKGVTIPRATRRSKLCAWCAKDLARRGLRWCSSCKTGKSPEEMTTERVCRACTSARGKAWREAHPGYAEERSRAYHAAHRDEMIAASRQYYQANREKLLAQKKDYYQANAERLRAKEQQRRRLGLISKETREKMRQRQRAKRSIYKANEKLNRARRLVQLLRGGV